MDSKTRRAIKNVVAVNQGVDGCKFTMKDGSVICIDGENDALKAWKQTHSWSLAFTPIAAVFTRKKFRGLPLVLFYETEPTPVPWSVQFAGNGHYFETLERALQYVEERQLLSDNAMKQFGEQIRYKKIVI